MTATLKTHAWELLALALFCFVFLGGEYFFDATLARFMSPADVVLNQGMILGASAVGFCSFEPFSRMRRRVRLACSIAFTVVGFGGIAVLFAEPDVLAMQAVGATCFLLLGLLGGVVHWMVSRRIAGYDRAALLVGIAYAAGIAIQFIVNATCVDRLAMSLALAIGAAALIAVCHRCSAGKTLRLRGRLADEAATGKASDGADRIVDGAKLNEPGEGERKIELGRKCGSECEGESHPAASPRDILWLSVIVALVSLMFITLDNIVTLADAGGDLDVGSWPRLLLAVSAIAAGALFDIRRRRYMNFIMFCVLMLSTIAILAAETNGGLFWGLVLFYLASGFFVTYFTTSFMVMAPRTRRPALWAGMGRAINNICAFVIVGPSLALIQAGDILLMIAVCMVLFVATIVAFFASGAFLLDAAPDEGGRAEANRVAFVDEYGLTPREAEVFALVTADERPLKEIASEMDISLRMLQKHLTSIYKKTDTQTRAGLTKKFLT